MSMKPAYPPPMLKSRAAPRIRKAFTAFCSVVLFVAVLFAATVHPVVAQTSTIDFEAPDDLIVGKNRTRTINADDYVTDGTNTFTCGNATGVDTTKLTSVSHTGNSCTFTIDPVDTFEGTATFTIPYTSSGGSNHDGDISITVGPASNIIANLPDSFTLTRNSITTADAATWASDGSYDITCTQGSRSFVWAQVYPSCLVRMNSTAQGGRTGYLDITYTSSGGDSVSRRLSFQVWNLAVTMEEVGTPPGWSVAGNQSVTINAEPYARSATGYSGFHKFCLDATSIDAKISSVTRSRCNYTVTAGATTGTATFTVPYINTSGRTLNRDMSVTITTPSDIMFSSPPDLEVGRNHTLKIDASGYATDGTYTISCNEATGIDNAKLTSVTRTANTCNYTIDPVNTYEGTATFTIPYTSSGGDEHDGDVSVTVGPESNIQVSVPPGLSIYRNGVLLIDASRYAGDGDYTISCGGSAKDIDAKLTSVTQSSDTCYYTIWAGNTLGSTSFKVPYISSGGDTHDGTITLTVSNPPPPPHRFVFREHDFWEIGTNRTLQIDASDYAFDAGGYPFTCQDATSVDPKINVRRPNPTTDSCDFSVTPTGTQGTASFTVTYVSNGGFGNSLVLNYQKVFTIEIGAASTISFSGPPNLKLGTDRSRTINARDYAPDGNYYITCEDATAVDAKITVARKDCSFTITPTGTQGAARFTVPYTSSGGDTHDGTINIQIGAASSITFTPQSDLTMTASSTLTVNAASYATDGSYAITCGAATARDAKIIRATNTGCSYQIQAGPDTGTATFTVPYTSEGGHTLAGQISINITALPRNTAPALDRQDMICGMLGLKPVRHSTADRITETDSQALFCHKPQGIHCQRGTSSALIPHIPGLSLDQLINTCYRAIS